MGRWCWVLVVFAGCVSEVPTFEDEDPPTWTTCFSTHQVPLSGTPWALDVDQDGGLELLAFGESHLELALDPRSQPIELERIELGFEPSELVTGDIDANGHPDLLITHEDGRFGILWGSGEGLSALDGLWEADLAGELALGDFDGNGHLDLIDSPDLVRMHLGNGDGTFGPPVERHSMRGGMAVADFDEDGIEDLAIARYAHFTVLFGRAEDPLGRREDFKRVDHSVSEFIAIDANNDGHADLVATGLHGSLAVFLGDGSGGFDGGGPKEQARLDTGEIADLDGDGVIDVLHAAPLHADSLHAHFGSIDETGAIEFGEALELDPTVDVARFALYDERFGPGFGAADWTGDGRADLAGFFLDCDGEECENASFLASCDE